MQVLFFVRGVAYIQILVQMLYPNIKSLVEPFSFHGKQGLI